MQTQAVCFAIYLSDQCNITRLREILAHTTNCFSTTDLKNTVPILLNKLLSQQLVSKAKDKFFHCGPKFNYQFLRQLLASPVCRQQLQCVQKIIQENRFLGSFNIQDLIPRVYFLSLWQGNAAEEKAVWDWFKENRHFFYYFRQMTDSQFQAAAVEHLFQFPDFNEEEFSALPEYARQKLFPHFLLYSVCCGKLLPDWRSEIFTIPDEKLQTSRLLASFFENDSSLLDKLSVETQDPLLSILADALSAVKTGDWKTADKYFTRYLNKANGETDDPNIILVMLIALFPACAVEASSTRLGKWFDYLRRCTFPHRHAILANVSKLYNVCCGTPGRFCLDQMKAGPIGMTAFFSALCQNSGAENPEKNSRQAVEKAWQMIAEKQFFWGIYLLNAAGTLLPADDAQREKIQAVTHSQGIVPFWSLGIPQAPWNHTLTALEKLFPKPIEKTLSAAPEDSYIAWHLLSNKNNTSASPQELLLASITPFLCEKSKTGKIRSGKKIPLKKLQTGEWDSLLPPQMLGIKNSIVQEHYGCKLIVEETALNFLTEAPHVFLDGQPVKLIQEKNSIISSRKSSGEMILQLKYQPDSSRFWGVETYTFLDTSEPGVCRFCTIYPNDPLVDFFQKFGNDQNKIIMPPEAGEKLAETMSKISHSVSVSGVLSQAAYGELPRQEGEFTLHVFLKRFPEGLEFSFRFLSCPACNWYVVPGKGKEEKILETAQGKIFLHRQLEKEKEIFKKQLSALPSVPEIILESGQMELEDLEEILRVLAELKEAGVVLNWHSESPLKISAKLSTAHLQLSSHSLSDWFAVGGNIQVSETKLLSLREILQKMDERIGHFIPLDDHSYLQLTHDLLHKLELLKAAGSLQKDHLKISPAALPMLSGVFDAELPEQLRNRVDRIREIFQQKITVPRNLSGTLRPYQENGFRYLAQMADCRLGCCLADDMGLGKTIQLLALLLREASGGPALVICPASLCSNWAREAEKFAPSLKVQIFSTAQRERSVADASGNDLLICSYGLLQSEVELFASRSWHTVILDEAHAIKNATTRRAHAVKKLQADIRIAATGTPVENRLLDLWSIFDFLNPGFLGSEQHFEKTFCKNEQPLPILKKMVSPLILRRQKEDVLLDLPPKTEITLALNLPEDARTGYELLRREALEKLQGEERSKIAVLAQLTKLRRFCCDPSLIWPARDAGIKRQRILELAQELKSAGHRALIFSQYVDFLQLILQDLTAADFACRYFDGSTPLPLRQKEVDEFQNGSGDFFLISLKAGGTGLNLTTADYVILADPWWNPAVEDQASGRAHRIGQISAVTIYRLILTGTVEEKIMELHARKRSAATDILSNSRNSTISAEQLLELFN